MTNLTREHKLRLQGLAYNQWAEAFDALKAVREETDDGSKDWSQFHASRLAHATEAEAIYRSLRDATLAEWPNLMDL
jgi:hypothetical protein